MRSTTAHNSPAWPSATITDQTPIPSWVKILDSPLFTGPDVNGGSTTEATDNGLLEELQEPTSWHHSPMLQVPVTGYHNRLTGSGPIPDLTQPAAGLFPSLASVSLQSVGPQNPDTKPYPSLASLSLQSVGPQNPGTVPYQDWPESQASHGQRGGDSGGLPPAGRWHSILDMANSLTRGDDLRKKCDRCAADCAAASCTHASIDDRILRPTTLLCSSAGQAFKSWPVAAEHGIYSELSHSPRLDKRSGNDEHSHAEESDLRDRYQNVSYHNDSHLDNGYSASLDGSVSALSADRPDVHKPEEYLSALQATDTFSVQYAHAPCGRCTRVVTSLLVVMSLAVVSLAAALTASVITRGDTDEKLAPSQGQPVVRVTMTLKILNKNFTSAMSQVESDAFYNIANPYSTELGRLFLKSPLAKIYRGNKVISLSPGSIKTSAELLFVDTGLIRDPMAVKNVITSADPASDWAQSDAREVGEFVVCSDCVTVRLEHTKIGQLPPAPLLADGGVLTSTVPRLTTKTTFGVNENVTTLPASATPKVTVSSTHPFITDGHYVITCDVIDADEWAEIRLEFKSDSKTQRSVELVTLLKTAPDNAQVAKPASSRVFAYPTISARSVGLVVNVTAITCADRGNYFCQVTLKDQRRYDGSGRVNILELPSLPEISKMVSPEFVWSAEPVYVCTVNLGYPIGELVFKAQSRNGSTSRMAYSLVSKDNCGGPVKATVRESSLPRDTVRLTCEVLTPHADLMAPGYPLTHFTLAKYVEIETKSTSLDDGLAAVRCRVANNLLWSRMSLLKESPAGYSFTLVALTPDGSTVWKELNLRQRSLVTSDVTAMTSELSVFIHSLKCTDDGVYKCALQVGDVLIEVEQTLTVTAKPSIPQLTLPVYVTERTPGPITLECTARVGHPAGSLVLAVKGRKEAEFREVMLNELTLTPLTCDTAVTGRYHTTGGQLGDGTAVTCSVLPPPAALPPFLNATRTSGLFTYLPDNLCLGAGQDVNITHPHDCRYIIQCSNDVIAEVSMCPNDLCFSALTSQCSEPVPLPTHALPEDQRCESSTEGATWPDVHQCTSYMQCLNRLPVTQHCTRGEIYVSGTQCSSDVTKSYCYKTLDWSFGVGTAVTQL